MKSIITKDLLEHINSNAEEIFAQHEDLLYFYLIADKRRGAVVRFGFSEGIDEGVKDKFLYELDLNNFGQNESLNMELEHSGEIVLYNCVNFQISEALLHTGNLFIDLANPKMIIAKHSLPPSPVGKVIFKTFYEGEELGVVTKVDVPNKNTDLAILHFSSSSKTLNFSRKQLNLIDAKVRDKVMVFGNEINSPTNGRVQSLHTWLTLDSKVYMDLILCSNVAGPGDSGAMVGDYANNVMGVVMGGNNKYTFVTRVSVQASDYFMLKI